MSGSGSGSAAAESSGQRLRPQLHRNRPLAQANSAKCRLAAARRPTARKPATCMSMCTITRRPSLIDELGQLRHGDHRRQRGQPVDESAKRLGLPGRLADHQPRRLERHDGPDCGRRQHGPVGLGEHGHGGCVTRRATRSACRTIRAWRATRPWPRRRSRSPARCSTMRWPA